MKPARAPPLSQQDITIVSSLDDCLKALLAHRPSPLLLQTAPGMLNYAGSLYIKKMEEAARAQSATTFTLIVDAGDDAGLAQGALRDGHRFLKFSGDTSVKQKLMSIAAQYKAVIL